MKPTLLTLILISFCFFNQAQTFEIDSCGLDNDVLLNQHEISYFNACLASMYEDNVFSFDQKRILFLNGDFGAKTISKSEFFEDSGKPWYEKDDFPSVQLIILTEDEKSELDNYDAILVSWSKIPVSERNRKKFIQNAKNHS